MPNLNLFISYSHKDINFLDEIKEFINEENLPGVHIWDDNYIELGGKWDETIKTKLKTADIVLLLVSQSFLQSKYIRSVELDIALKRHYEGKSVVIPIFVRDSDLEGFKDIISLQGIPTPQNPLISNPELKDKHYLALLRKVRAIINSKLFPPPEPPDPESFLNKKIFLSIPESSEGIKKRNSFIYQVDGKIRHNEWQYGEIVPNIQMTEEILQKPDKERIEILKLLLNDCSYGIHIFDNEDSQFFKMQYQLAKEGEKTWKPYRNIIWVLNLSKIEDFDLELHTNPCVKSTDFEKVFDLIDDIEIQRNKFISDIKVANSAKKKVYMIYDFNKDHNNATRIKLKKKLEKDVNISVIGKNVSEEKLSEEREILEKCQGAVIFYGYSDYQWFLKRQDNIILDSKIKAVCVVEPHFETKIDRDIWKSEIDLIRGHGDLEFEIDTDIFINKLKSASK